MIKTDKKREYLQGTIAMGLGLLLIAAALLFIWHHLRDEKRAAGVAEEIVVQLSAAVEREPMETPDVLEEPAYIHNPGMEMPIITIENEDCLGSLSIPALELVLPVLDDWNEARLKKAPCRYAGSVYQDNMVIAAHNYASHFGNLSKLHYGDHVMFCDADGNGFLYEVGEIVILEPSDKEAMVESDWDLTLFTCTVGGKNRVTVRCVRVE